MQKLKKTFSLLITVLILLMTFTASAYAAEATQDGLKAQIIFEKENYGKNEEIPIKIIVKNTNNYDVQNVSIEGLIPDGLTLISDTATKSVDLLQSGETLELTYKIKLIDNITPSEPVTVVPTTEEPITNTTTTELPTENAATTETPNANVPTTIEPTTAYAENYQIGDVNNDKKITASDARLALRISAQLINATDLQIKAADTDNNGKISASDARKILRVSAKLDSFEDNSRTNNILTPLSSNLSDKKTGNISFMPLAVNSGKTISINNENSINTNINNIISLALGTCLSVIAVFMLIYFTRKDKNFKKRALSIMISVLIVLSSVSGISLFKAVASNEERKSFTISETVTVDGEEVTFYSAVWYLENNNIAEEDNENMISVEEIEKIELVLDTISNSMKSGEYIKLDSNNEKVEYINNMLSALSNQELIIKNSIQYSESGNCFAYKHINGVRSFIWLNTSNNLEVNLNNKSLSNEDKLLYINNDTKAYNSNREITDAVDTVFMYGFDNINEEYSYFEKYDLLMREYSKLGLLTNIYSNPTVFDYKTAFTDAEYINILEHGGFDPNLNISYFCVTGDKPDENTLLSYNTDIYFERILSGTNESGEKVFIITPKFFEFYYSNDKLDGAVVFLFCCKGFGTDGNVNYEFAKAFEKCGADTIIGFHNSVFEGYAFSIYKEFTDLMLFGYSTGDSLSDAKDLFGNNDVEYGKKFFPLSEYWQKVDPKINKTWKQSLEEHSNAAYPIIYGDENKKFDIITGKITGTVIDSKTNDPLSNITVKATIGDFVRTTLTDENGEFSIKLPVGEWEISVEATDTHYCNEKRTVTVEKNKDVTLSPPFYMKNGAEVSGTVKDKNTDTPIANATIEVFDNSNTLIMEGIDGTYNYEDFKLGELITTTATDENGNYSISLPSGKYAIAVNHDNYNFNGILLTVEQGFDEYLSQNILLTPKSEDDSGEDNTFAGGDGTEENPYQVATPDQLNAVRYHLDSHFIQTADIDMSDWGNWEPIGKALPIYSTASGSSNVEEQLFTGTYDGNSFIIENLTIIDNKVSPQYDCYGLFAGAENATIKNINLKNISIDIDKSTTDYVQIWEDERQIYSVCVGGIVGICRSSSNKEIIIRNCTVSGLIKVDFCNDAYVGGITGYGAPIYCKNTTEIHVNANASSRDEQDSHVYCGGITGHSGTVTGLIHHCFNGGSLSVTGGNYISVGGIAGRYGNISDCCNMGDISGKAINCSGYSSFAEHVNAGGIVGATSSEYVKNCINYGVICSVATGNKKGATSVTAVSGGIVGYCGYYGNGATINCYNFSSSIYAVNSPTNSDESFGNAGRISGYSISNIDCYSWNKTFVNKELVTSSSTTNNDGMDLQDKYILKEETYTNFDFKNTWIIDPTIGGAVLR